MNFKKLRKGWIHRPMTLALTALMFAVGSAVLFAGQTQALPLAPADAAVFKHIAQDSDVILVRDGCGRGMRFSNRRGGCVEDFNSAPRVVVVPRGCGRGFRMTGRGDCVPVHGGDDASRVINSLIGQAIGGGGRRGDGCGPGLRFSNSRGRCVPN
jgi:hypothetical protein